MLINAPAQMWVRSLNQFAVCALMLVTGTMLSTNANAQLQGQANQNQARGQYNAQANQNQARAQYNAQTQQAQRAQQQRQQQQQQQYNPAQLTPEQRAAQQQAAMQSPAQQRAAQEAYAAEMERALQKRIQQPKGFPLDAQHTKYVDDLLTYWQKNSDQVSKYQCNFRRFEYNSLIVKYRDPKTNQLAAHTVAFGEIRFAAPDRARYETTQIMHYKNPPKQPGAEAEYEEANPEDGQNNHERWICDGKKIFEFDFQNKRINETELPREMQGNVAESPLPFIFGGKKHEVLERYWVRSATPKGVQDEYWLELYPKRVQDARIYSKIELVISQQDFLPKAMHMYDPLYNPEKGNESSRYFTFENRQVNSQLLKWKDAMGAFVRPKLPGLGWKRVVRTAGQNQAIAPPELRLQGQPGQQQPGTRR